MIMLYANAISLSVSAPVIIIFPVLNILVVISFISSEGRNFTLTAEYLSGSNDVLKTDSNFCAV